MNRKEAERLSKSWFRKSPWSLEAFHKEHASLLLRTYKKGVKDALNKIESLDPLESTCCGEWDDACDVAEGVQKWLLIQARKSVNPITKGRKHEAR